MKWQQVNAYCGQLVEIILTFAKVLIQLQFFIVLKFNINKAIGFLLKISDKKFTNYQLTFSTSIFIIIQYRTRQFFLVDLQFVLSGI